VLAGSTGSSRVSDRRRRLLGLSDAENGFSAREAEERLEAEGFTP
jgi:hypothetical protein